MVHFRRGVELGPLSIAPLALIVAFVERLVGFRVVFCDDDLRDNSGYLFGKIGMNMVAEPDVEPPINAWNTIDWRRFNMHNMNVTEQLHGSRSASSRLRASAIIKSSSLFSPHRWPSVEVVVVDHGEKVALVPTDDVALLLFHSHEVGLASKAEDVMAGRNTAPVVRWRGTSRVIGSFTLPVVDGLFASLIRRLRLGLPRSCPPRKPRRIPTCIVRRVDWGAEATGNTPSH